MTIWRAKPRRLWSARRLAISSRSASSSKKYRSSSVRGGDAAKRPNPSGPTSCVVMVSSGGKRRPNPGAAALLRSTYPNPLPLDFTRLFLTGRTTALRATRSSGCPRPPRPASQRRIPGRWGARSGSRRRGPGPPGQRQHALFKAAGGGIAGASMSVHGDRDTNGWGQQPSRVSR